MSSPEPASSPRAPGGAVFLSYASQDAEAVLRLAEALRASGVEVWFDKDELVGGDAWDAKIRGQIASCALFVPVISAATQTRLEGYFRIEWKLAARRTHAMATAKAFLLPVVIDATRDAEAHVPDEFRDVQWTRLPGGKGAGVEKFCARVGKLLDGEQAVARASRAVVAEITGQETRATKKRNPTVAWVAAAVGVALVLTGFPLLRPSPNAGTESHALRPGQAQSPLPAEKSVVPLTKAEQLIAQARALYEPWELATADDFILAERLLKEATDLEPTNAEGWAAAAILSFAKTQFRFDRNAAQQSFSHTAADRAVKFAPESDQTKMALALRYRVDRATKGEAVKILQELAARRSTDKFVLRQLGHALASANQREQALACFEQAAALPGGDANAHCLSGQMLQTLNRFEPAVAAFDRAIALRPDFGDAYLKKLILLSVILGDIERAKVAVQQIPARVLRDERVASASMICWFFARDLDRTTETLRLFSGDVIESNSVFFTKGLFAGHVHFLANRKDAAAVEWRAALRVIEQRLVTNPTSQLELREKALLLALLGERPPAEETLRLLEQLAPPPAGRANRGNWEIYAALGREKEVLDYFAEALTQEPERKQGLAAGRIRFDPMLDPFRSHPRFQALMAEADRIFAARADGPPPAAELTPMGDAKSVAVLAFKNLSGDPAREFFSDGLSEAVTDVLGRVPGLKVVGSASAFSFKGKSVSIPEIARQLVVTHLVEGTVLQEGQTVRVTAKLIQADGFQVGPPEQVRHELKNIFALHDDVASRIAKNLSLKLGVATGWSQREINPEAYQLYMQARQAWNLRNTEGFARAEGLLDRALKLEPDFAQAHAALADVWISRSGQAGAFGTFEHRRSPEKARVMAKIEHALRLDPDSAEARASLGAVAWYDWDFTTAERELRSAVALNPNYATAHSWLGRVIQSQGRTDEALAELRLATEIDPLSPVVLANYCGRLVEVGRETEALAMAERALALHPDSRSVLMHKAQALLNRGLLPEAAGVARQLVATGPTDPNNLFPAVFILAGAGATAEATTMMAQLPAWGRLPRSALLLAFGKRDEAIAALDAPGQNVNFLGYVLYDRRYDPIRSDPRFARYLAELGLTDAHARAQAWRKAHPPEKPAR